ncbi:MAG: hypothetical protein QG574_4895 [Cyanobacteriota bacterium erpe_2018_sw_21hr_WHONDRS-SW48-000092_B_bin.40]|jgi:S-adenosylmethionine-diacylglycerol 3-amino-3-carboxypropyl transferase|nr:hypothetical protein [Cyanobacteriota bacterium erpe_2018_sw_21hr_WHONDRS-SW48-000092_B_bin.40]
MTINVEQLSKKELFHAQGRLMFGQVREDAAVDLFLVRQLQSPNRFFVIASGGCTALSLLTVDSCSVDALDISQAQIALVELKAALYKHLGFAAAKQACIADGRAYLKQVNSRLSPRAQQFFSARSESLKSGLNNSGWVDQRMHQLTKLFYLFVHSLEETQAFLGLDEIDKQREFYSKRWCNWQWKLTMKVAFSRLFLRLAHGNAAERLVPDDFSGVMEGRLVRAFTDFPNAANPYLWQAFFAQYNSSEAGLPPYLQSANGALIEANIDRLNLVCEDTITWLGKQPTGSIDYFGLSNILELLPPEYAVRLRAQIVRCGSPGAIVCVRSIFRRRAAVFEENGAGAVISEVDRDGADLANPNFRSLKLVFDRALSDRAEEMDRSLFCNFYEIYRCV